MEIKGHVIRTQCPRSGCVRGHLPRPRLHSPGPGHRRPGGRVGDLAGEGHVDRLTLSPVTRLTQKRPQKRLRTIGRRSGISMPFELARGSCQKLAASTRSPATCERYDPTRPLDREANGQAADAPLASPRIRRHTRFSCKVCRCYVSKGTLLPVGFLSTPRMQ